MAVVGSLVALLFGHPSCFGDPTKPPISARRGLDGVAERWSRLLDFVVADSVTGRNPRVAVEECFSVALGAYADRFSYCFGHFGFRIGGLPRDALAFELVGANRTCSLQSAGGTAQDDNPNSSATAIGGISDVACTT